MSLVQLFCSLWLSAQQLYGEVNGNLQEGFCHGLCDQVAAPRAPAPAAGHCWLAPPQKTQTQVWLRLCKVSGSWCAQGFVWALRASLAGMGFDTKRDFFPSNILLGLLFCPWMWGIFFGGIQHSPVDGYSEASCNCGVLTGEDELMFFFSTILPIQWVPAFAQL